MLLGYLIQETLDSFIVLLPTYLRKSPDGMIYAEVVLETGPVRVFKSNIRLMYQATAKQLLYFLGLTEPYFENNSSYFNDTRVTHLKGIHELIKQVLGVVREELVVGAGKPVVTSSQQITAPPSKTIH